MQEMKSARRIQLDDHAWLDCWDSLPAIDDTRLLDELVCAVRWQQPAVTLYGRRHRLPRLQCWMGDAGAQYKYSGLQLQPDDWLPCVARIREAVETLSGHHFNAVLINLYRNGEDRMGWHSDDEPELGPEPWLASYNLGASRELLFREKGHTRQRYSLTLAHNQLLLMNPVVQKRWQHSLPVRRRVTEPRINLTFRRVSPVQEA